MNLGRFLSSYTGKRFYNFAYCWGACLVILGAVFKIAHMPHDNLLLMIGLFTEVFIFFISGFDEPAREYKWERVFPALLDKKAGASSTGASVSASAALDAGQYAAQFKMLEQNITQLNAAYAEQLRKLSDSMSVVDPATLAELKKEMQNLATNVTQLNRQYEQMLEAMNIKVKS